MEYSTDKFLEYLYAKSQIRESLLNCPDEEFSLLFKRKRGRLAYILRLHELKDLQIKLSCSEKEIMETTIYKIKKFDVEFLPYLKVPVWILEPHQNNGKSILYCHGHDKKGAQGAFTKCDTENPYHNYFPIRAAKHGYTLVIPEFIGYGEAVKENYVKEYDGCYANEQILSLYGLNLLGVRVFEVMSIIEIMKKIWRMKSISVFGTSIGGMTAGLLAAVSRDIECAVVSNYGAYFCDSVMKDYHCTDSYIHELLGIGECGEILSLCAKTPLFLSNGKKDKIFPYESVKKTVGDIKNIYKRCECEDKFEYEFHDGGHEVFFETVIDFIDRYTEL